LCGLIEDCFNYGKVKKKFTLKHQKCMNSTRREKKRRRSEKGREKEREGRRKI
jgi:hypothetical protein